MLHARPLTSQRALLRLLSLRQPNSRRSSHDQPTNAPRGRNVVEINDQPSLADESGARTLRERQHGQKALPLPPLIDPRLRAARERHRGAKPEQDESQMTEFQKELASNAYALALSGPVRFCELTTSRLPAHFLLSFRLNYAENDSINQDDNKVSKSSRRIIPRIELSTGAKPLPRAQRAGTQTYAVNRLSLFHVLQGKRTRRKTHAWFDLVSQNMKTDYMRHVRRQGTSEPKPHKSWTWEAEMLAKMEDALKRNVAGAFMLLLRRERDAFIALAEGVETPSNAAFVITFSSDQEAAENLGTAQDIQQGLMKYNLTKLMGDQAAEMRNRLSEGSLSWAVLKSSDSANFHLHLERIYMFFRENSDTIEPA